MNPRGLPGHLQPMCLCGVPGYRDRCPLHPCERDPDPDAEASALRKALHDVVAHLAALVPVVHNGCPRRLRERHHAILAELSRLLP